MSTAAALYDGMHASYSTYSCRWHLLCNPKPVHPRSAAHTDCRAKYRLNVDDAYAHVMLLESNTHFVHGINACLRLIEKVLQCQGSFIQIETGKSAWRQLLPRSCRSHLLVQSINAGLPLGGKVLQHWGGFIRPIPRQGYPLSLGPLVLLGGLRPLDKVYQGPKLAQQLLLPTHAGACHQLIL